MLILLLLNKPQIYDLFFNNLLLCKKSAIPSNPQKNWVNENPSVEDRMLFRHIAE
jgi:hypothetical protein